MRTDGYRDHSDRDAVGDGDRRDNIADRHERRSDVLTNSCTGTIKVSQPNCPKLVALQRGAKSPGPKLWDAFFDVIIFRKPTPSRYHAYS